MHFLDPSDLTKKVDYRSHRCCWSHGSLLVVCSTSSREHVLTMCSNIAGYGKGRSICSVSQSEAFGLDIRDCVRKHGAEQKIVIPNGIVLKLHYTVFAN